MVEIETVGSIVQAGSHYFSGTPLLANHSESQPDLYLAWNRIPSSAATVDVVL